MESTSPNNSIVDAIKKSTNILVTVSHDPSVDALAAALGFSLMIDKLDKHATAVFSGKVPHAIAFLDPDKHFEDNVSSLRDFIIALDKEKADRLRYKVEGNVVRIYITPYRTTITQKDLEFSEGDFNVDLVVALGVKDKSQLDSAITTHGKILHDATVATVNNNADKVAFGDVNWSDDKASSLCEMLMSLSESLQPNLLDEQTATALLTGIVSATERFSNAHTTPRVMTMSAQLMAAGANQQLIAEKLQQDATPAAKPRDGSTPLQEGESTAVDKPVGARGVPPKKNDTGEMHVNHKGDDVKEATEDAERIAEVASEERRDQANAALEEALGHNMALPHAARQHSQSPSRKSSDWREALDQDQDKSEAEDKDEELPPVVATYDDGEPSFPPIPQFTPNENPYESPEPIKPAAEPSPEPASVPEIVSPRQDERLTEPEKAKGPENSEQPDPGTLVDSVSPHGKTLDPVTMQPIKSPSLLVPEMPVQTAPTIQPPVFNPIPSGATDPLAINFEESPLPETQPNSEAQTLADLESQVNAAAAASPVTSSINEARNAVNSAFGEQPLSVGGQPLPVQDTTYTTGEMTPPLPPPPMPDFSAMPPMPPMPDQAPQLAHPADPQTTPVPQPAAAPAPNQFQIPGQG